MTSRLNPLRIFGIVPAVCGILLAALIPCFAQGGTSGISSTQGPTFAVPVRTGDCVEIFTYRGELEACESVNIHAPDLREANLMTIRNVLEDGTVVKNGDIIVEMDDGTFQIALEAAKQELDLAQAEMERIRFELANEAIDLDLNIQRQELDLEKSRVMVVEGSVVISRIDLQKAKLSVELAKLELEQAKKTRVEFDKKKDATLKVQELQVVAAKRKIDLQTENIEKSKVKAPRDGIVYKPFVRMNNEMGRIEPNKVVRPGDKLLELPNMDNFQGVVYIPSPDYSYIHVGEPATVTLCVRPGQPFSGRVLSRDLYPVSRNERLGRNDPEGYLKEYKVVIAMTASSSEFRPGMTFQADLGSMIASACLYIPRIAVASLSFVEENICADAGANSEVKPNGIGSGNGNGNGVGNGSGNASGSANEEEVVKKSGKRGRKEKSNARVSVGETDSPSSSSSSDGNDTNKGANRKNVPSVSISGTTDVWVRGTNGPEKRTVHIGRFGISFVEIVSGLSASDQVYLDYPAEL
ncbi:MAG: HlyD family efflux transporter periplasmic adaptor subunit [Candidatus Ozemobacteraceae bacterium]